jgi:hypothetical protein
VAGVDAQHSGYRGILYNALVVALILRDSEADFVLMVQMDHTSNSTKLLPIEEYWLKELNVIIKYLDPPEHGLQNFYTAQFEKFHILEWTEYSRVIFMDGDVMPFCPMDYLFELSESGVIKENLVLAWSIEPAHGGFFMLAPHENDFQTLEDMITRREKEVLDTGIIFNLTTGWGHPIEPRGWRSISGRVRTHNRLWDFHGDFVDQGLLYHWVKYHKKDVSIVVNEETENWSSRPSKANLSETELYLDQILVDTFDDYTCVKGLDWPRPRRFSQLKINARGEVWEAPTRDFIRKFQLIHLTISLHKFTQILCCDFFKYRLHWF